MTYVSFGAGTQSTALAFLVMNEDERLIERAGVEPGSDCWPRYFAFADTGDEPRSVYRHLWKMAELFDHHGIELHIVRNGDESLSEHVIRKARAGEGGISTPPLFVESKDGSRGDGIPMRRSCTADFKARPLDDFAKRYWTELAGCEPEGKSSALGGWSVPQWLGISRDEKRRMRTSDELWRTFKYPLIEMGWTRWHCQQYLKSQTYLDGSPVEIVRSACVYCPFHDKEEWRHVKSNPEDWERVIEFEREIHDIHDNGDGIAGIKRRPYLNRWAVEMADLDLTDDDDQLNLWDEYAAFDVECVGHCGV